MHTAERRTEGDHLQIGILFEEQTALQPGMDGADLGFGAEQPSVGIDGDLQQLRLRVGHPARIAVGMGHIGARQREDRLDHLHHVGLGALDRRPLRRGDNDAVALRELHRSEVRRGLDQPRNGERHGHDPVGNAHQRVDQRRLRPAVEHLVDVGHLVERDFEIGFAEAEFGFEVRGEKVVTLDELLLEAGRNAEDGVSLAGNGIAEVAAVEIAQFEFERLHAVPQQARHGLVRVDAALVDVVARVSALKVRHVDTEERVVLRRRLHRVVERGDGVDAARTADEDFALVLRIEVDEVFAREHPLAQLERTREARLLVDGEQRFDGTVLHRLVEHHGQRGGHADTAVGAQRRTFGPDPLAVDTRADGIVVEVELHIGVLFADHVHVRLEDHGCALLHARRGGLAHHDVADGVLFIFDMVLFGEIDQKINDFALLLRRTRHTRDGVELFPD